VSKTREEKLLELKQRRRNIKLTLEADLKSVRIRKRQLEAFDQLLLDEDELTDEQLDQRIEKLGGLVDPGREVVAIAAEDVGPIPDDLLEDKREE